MRIPNGKKEEQKAFTGGVLKNVTPTLNGSGNPRYTKFPFNKQTPATAGEFYLLPEQLYCSLNLRQQ